jgi:hypothetical protein
MLIIDRKEKTVELFDPHGSNASSSEVKNLMVTITNFLMSHGYQEEMTSFEKLGPLHLCPKRPHKWQTKVETCRWFSSLYLVARLFCPFQSRREIIEMFVSTGVESEQELMTKFYCFVQDCLPRLWHTEEKLHTQTRFFLEKKRICQKKDEGVLTRMSKKSGMLLIVVPP